MLTLPAYELEAKIYQGNATLVYRGQRRSDGLPVTLKTHRAAYPTPVEEARFRREYEIGCQVQSPGVVQYYGLEQHQQRLFLVCEDFGAQGLRAVMQPEGVELSLFLDVALQLAAALGDIHQQRIIHKDVKTGNVLINPGTMVVKVIDFGIATQLKRERQQFLNPERLEGTLAYISPEQTGRMNRAIDYRSDFYSLGVTLYELLCGRLPFESQDALELVHSHIARTAPPPQQIRETVPRTISEIIVKLMAKNARERYQSARGLQADLENARRQWQEQGQVRPFVLGQEDVTERFQIPQKLYGRQPETEALLEGFERVAQGGRELLLLSGYAGIGKSVLVHELHKPITERRGYFISGKYDQLQRNIPYNAIVCAFEKLVQQLLTEDAAQLARWKENLLRALGPNGQVIIDVIPQVELIVGQQPALPELGPAETQNRLNLVFQNFVRVFCRPEHPLVVFLDDLQWVDTASLNLIKLMLTDTDTRHLLLIGSYRDNEVDTSHPLTLALETLREGRVSLNKITLAPLSLEHVTRLVAETLYDAPDSVRPLAELVHRKTNGNPFFTNQFLTRLYEDGLLTFVYHGKENGKQAGWRWELSAIQAQSITGNVVELMLQKLRKLPPRTQACLQLAACIGNQFDLAMLSVIFEQGAAKTLAALWKAVQEDLVMPLDKNYQLPGAEAQAHFAFLHDRLQQAAYALIDDVEKPAIHLQVGRLLLARLPQEQRDEHIFDIVNHLNLGARLITSSEERQALARLNLVASQKAKNSLAYGPAAQYISLGRNYLTQDSWASQHDLTFKLYRDGAECEYLLGHFDETDQMLDIAFEHCASDLERGQLYTLRLTHKTAQGQYAPAISLGIQALKIFGLDLPGLTSPDEIHQFLDQELTWFQQNWAGRAISELEELPVNEDPRQNMAMAILSTILDCAVIGVPDYLGVLTITVVNYSIKHGNTSVSPVGYIFHATVLSALQEYDAAYQFGELALTLNERKIKNSAISCKLHNMFGGFISCLHNSYKANIAICDRGYPLGLESGDLVYAAYNLVNKARGYLFAGATVSDFLVESKSILANIKKLNYVFMFDLVQVFNAHVYNLLGKTQSIDTFEHKGFQERVYREKYAGLSVMTTLLDFYKLKSFCILGNYQRALPIIMDVDLTPIEVQTESKEFRFYAALTLLNLYPEADETTKKSYGELIKTYHALITKLADICPVNFRSHEQMLAAERARIEGREVEALDLYDQAIASAQESELIHNAALANELAAKFWLAKGKEKIARVYVTSAHQLYTYWGATAKVRDLEQKYPQLLAQPTTPARVALAQTVMSTTYTGTDTDATSLLDLSSVVKASQAISSEIELDKLLANLLDIVLENAGAQRGCLALEKGGQLLIEAYGEVGGKVQVLQALPIEGKSPLLAPEIARYVTHTHESVVLDDASQQGAFTSSPYVIEQRVRSVLCTPLISRGVLLGLIYLENNLVVGAFTPERVELLRLLGTQASISLTNARALRLRLRNAQLEAENARMEAELDVARRLQLMLLPSADELTQIEGLDIAGFMQPAEEVGGDYYDVLQHNGRLKIGIGDVTGHGLESGVVMLMLQTAVRTLLMGGVTDVAQLIVILNRVLHANMQRMQVDKSMSLVLLDYQAGLMKLNVSGQHEQLIVVRQDRKVELLNTLGLGFPLGLEAEIDHCVGALSVELHPGDGIVLYSDGFTEAENAVGEFYGLERLCDVVSQHWAGGAEEIKEAIVSDARAFIGEHTVYDDLALLVVKQK